MRPSAAALALASLLAAPTSQAFRDAPIGTPIRNRTLPTVDGGKAPLLGEGKVGVFVFVRAGQEFSEITLRHLATLEAELAGRPVRLVAIVSDGDREGIRPALAEAGLRMPVLVDEGDALYGELGVMMTPVAGVVGRDRRLAAHQPFRKVNFLDALRGQVRLALGEIGEAELARILDPGVQAAPQGGRARARVRLARTLLAAGSVDAALESARAGVALEPALGDAHQVLAEALARKGLCAEAAAEADAARRLSPAAPPAVPCGR